MDKVEEHEDVSGDVHDGGDVDEAVGQHGTADGSDHRQPWGRLPPQSPDEERQLVHRRAKIGPRPARSSQGVRPLPHENRRLGAGALVSLDVALRGLARGPVHQPWVWRLEKIESSSTQPQ